MKATLIGTIDGRSFQQGVSLVPVLDSSALMVSQADLDAIFGPSEQKGDEAVTAEKPGYCIHYKLALVIPSLEWKLYRGVPGGADKTL